MQRLLSCAIDEPRVVPVKWPAGFSKWPIPGTPFQLRCPLQSNPPANYTWTRYQSLDRRVKLNFSSDVKFSSDEHTWTVASFSKDHNGVYECHASNEVGGANYRNDALFFLKPDGEFSSARVSEYIQNVGSIENGVVKYTCIESTYL